MRTQFHLKHLLWLVLVAAAGVAVPARQTLLLGVLVMSTSPFIAILVTHAFLVRTLDMRVGRGPCDLIVAGLCTLAGMACIAVIGLIGLWLIALSEV